MICSLLVLSALFLLGLSLFLRFLPHPQPGRDIPPGTPDRLSRVSIPDRYLC